MRGTTSSMLALLFDFTIRGSMVLSLTALAVYLLRGATAAARARAWGLGIVAALALPAIGLIAPRWSHPVVVGLEPTRQMSIAIAASLILVWLAGVIILSGGTVGGRIILERRLRTTQSVLDGDWLTTANALAQSLRVRRPFLLKSSSSFVVPAAVGVVYPAIVLPPSALHSAADRRRMILTHELVHVRGWDTLLHLRLALLLAVVGLYGVLAFRVSQRTHEIGVRMALGAQRRDVQRLVVGQGMSFGVCGVAIGIVAALATARALDGLLFGLSSRDPHILAAVAATLLAVALVASYVPALRASRIDPMEALREL